MEVQSSGQGSRARPIRVAVLTAALVVAMVAATIGAFTFGGYLAGHTSAAPLSTSAQPLSAAAQSTATTSSVAGLSVADVAAKANPWVVTISNFQPVSQNNGGFFGLPGTGNGTSNGQPQLAGKGSGFIIDSKGDVITNAHVVAGATQLSVEFYNGKTANAKLIGADPIQDIAVIRIDLTGGVTLPGIATLGNSNTVRPGDPVVAIGSALGTFDNTVTDGIVGGINRVLDEGNGSTPLINLIQHDAPLSSGNSGGPLLNLQGQVIGVNVAAIPNGSVGAGNQANGLDFAISINAAKNVADQLIATGHVSYPFLGITSEANPSGQGAQVDSVQSGTPADKAGLQQGDIITALDGQQITDQTPLVALLYQHKPGDKVTLTVNRNGQTQTITVTLGTLSQQSQ